ncbi:unnamed protein product [Heligmosomoides polygyrus]|uniref:AKAP_110 domain-containing protein n=1 Tax=Heligmosomoides polygyrus TaxID=6339 RepID=A0A183FDU0_HELPZ|nr:unnamed protein product [Heligmosomoides polygyrus]
MMVASESLIKTVKRYSRCDTEPGCFNPETPLTALDKGYPQSIKSIKNSAEWNNGMMSTQRKGYYPKTDPPRYMSSTSSSVCSSNDIDYGLDSKVLCSFGGCQSNVLATPKNTKTSREILQFDGESMCVSVHAALEMVSESMRDLFKHPQFKTNNVILPSLQLVQGVKDLKFDSSMVETTRVHNIIDQLESAVLNTIILHTVLQTFDKRFACGTQKQPRDSAEPGPVLHTWQKAETD